MSLALLLAWSCQAASRTPEALVASLAQTPPANALFKEVRFDPMLDKPLVLTGELAWLGGDHLKRMVVTPWTETTDVSDGKVTLTRGDHRPRHFSLSRSPELESVLGSFQSLLSGESAGMLKAFEATVAEDGPQWTLTLVPRDERLRKHVATIVVYGAGTEPRCMRIDNAESGNSLTLLGALSLAPLPDPVTSAALETMCQTPADDGKHA